MRNPDAIINKMDQLGRNGVPFIFIIDFEMKKPLVIPLASLPETGILYDINGVTNYTDNKTPADLPVSMRKYPLSYADYLKAFRKVQKHISYGNSYLLNLTFPTKIEMNLSLMDIFIRSRAKYKLLMPDRFVVFSPEIFVQIDDSGVISSFPMKGTIDASIENAEEKILNDKKETAEHCTIVDLIRNDLSMVATNVNVEKFRYIDNISTHESELLQVSSKISGQLFGGYKILGHIIFDLLPAGSVSGAPKQKTLEIIKKSEGYERGYYTGVFGIFDGKTLDSGVMIRFIENINGELFYKSGGGITAFSNPENEYKELTDKVYVPFV
jgi:para-aminobenzoate synthetase component I